MIKKRTTVYLDTKLLKLLKIRSIKSDQSMSEYINNIIYQDLLEEQEDLKDIKKILKQPSLSLSEMIKILKLEDEI